MLTNSNITNIPIYPKIYRILDDIEYRVIKNSEDLEDVYKLRYKAYRNKGYMEFNHGKICYDKLDGAKNTRIFGIYYGSKLISSIRTNYLSSENMTGPSTLVYGDLLRKKLDAGKTFVDSSRFVNDPDFELGGNLVHLLTMRVPILACQYFNADYSLSLVRSSHGAFYRRYFGSKILGFGRNYPELKFAVDLYSSEVELVRSNVLRRYPFMNSLKMERDILFDDTIGQRCCFTAFSTAKIASQERSRELQNMAA